VVGHGSVVRLGGILAIFIGVIRRHDVTIPSTHAEETVPLLVRIFFFLCLILARSAEASLSRSRHASGDVALTAR
jgi:hypothetical protein